MVGRVVGRRVVELVAALVCTPGHLVTYIHGGQNQHGNW